MRPVLEEENVAEIARKHNKTPAQVLLRHGLQRGIVVLVKSVTPERIKSNFDVSPTSRMPRGTIFTRSLMSCRFCLFQGV